MAGYQTQPLQLHGQNRNRNLLQKPNYNVTEALALLPTVATPPPVTTMTIERAHMPKNLWEKIKLPSNYEKAIELIDKHLVKWIKVLDGEKKIEDEVEEEEEPVVEYVLGDYELEEEEEDIEDIEDFYGGFPSKESHFDGDELMIMVDQEDGDTRKSFKSLKL